MGSAQPLRPRWRGATPTVRAGQGVRGGPRLVWGVRTQKWYPQVRPGTALGLGVSALGQQLSHDVTLMCLIIGQVGRKGRKEMRLLTGYLERFKEVGGEIGWMDGWVDGWVVGGWMDGWVDGWMDG